MKKIWLTLFVLIAFVEIVCGQKISAKQIYADIDYLKLAIAENYPYLEVHKRKDGFDWEKAVANLWNSSSNIVDKNEALTVFNKYLLGLNGHVHFIDDNQYAYYLNCYKSILKDYPEYQAWVDVLTSKKSESIYGRINFKQSSPIANGYNSGKGFDKEILGNIIYIQIPTFDGYFEKEEGPKIVSYLKSLSDYSKYIILDIRGNGGGSDLFWLNWIVKPMISSTIEYSNYNLFKAGTISMPFLKAKKITLTDIKSLPKEIQRPETMIFKYYYMDRQTIESTATQIKYKKIYVLMDNSNFSSSESFVHFCKATGFATLVGQRSSGDGIGFDPIVVQLPNTGFIFTMPIDAALNDNGTLNFEFGTEPDISINKSIDSKKYVFELIAKQK
jgi:hypothetical protein